MTGTRLAEVTLLSRDLTSAVEAWRRASGLEAQVAGGEGMIVVGDVVLRILSTGGSASAAELVAKYGDGMYGIAIEVDDVVDMMNHLRARAVLVSGVAMVDGRREVTIDPRSTFGVPIRLVEKQ